MRGPVALSLKCANNNYSQWCLYRYTKDLLMLASAKAPKAVHGWPRYRTPICVQSLVPALSSHPDTVFASYILDGLTHGFRIGFDHRSPLRTGCSNHPSSLVNDVVVEARIRDEVSTGRLYGPLPPNLTPLVQISPMGLIPKPHQPNKYRLIVDLSHPTGGSINDGISTSLCAHCSTHRLMRQSESSKNSAQAHN